MKYQDGLAVTLRGLLLGSPCEDHLSFLLPGVELDVGEFISDALKTVYIFCAPLVSRFLPARGWGQTGPMGWQPKWIRAEALSQISWVPKG